MYNLNALIYTIRVFYRETQAKERQACTGVITIILFIFSPPLLCYSLSLAGRTARVAYSLLFAGDKPFQNEPNVVKSPRQESYVLNTYIHVYEQ